MDELTRVLHIVSSYPSRVDPIDGIFIKRQVELLASYLESNVVHFQEDSNLPFFATEKSREKNKLVVYYNSGYRWLRTLFLGVLFFRTLIIGHNSEYPEDIVHAHNTFHAGWMAYLYCKWHKKKYILSEHSSFFLLATNLRIKDKVKWIIARKVIDRAALILPVSKALGDRLKSGANFKTSVIGNSVQDVFFTTSLSTSTGSSFNILHVTSGRPIKNSDKIFRCIESLLTNEYNIRFLVVAYGDIVYVQKLLQRYNFGNDLKLYLNLNPEEMARIMTNVDLLVQFSDFETFGIVLAEAWAMGIPIVTSSCGGLTDLVKTNLGVSLKKNDTKALCTAIADIISGKYEWNRSEIRGFAKENYSEEVIRRQLLTAYKSI